MGEMESLLVERIIDATWRLRRLSRVEASIFTWELYEELAQRAQEEAQTYEFYMGEGPSLTGITDEQKHQEAISKAEEMKSKQHRAETATLGRTFIRDADTANAFSKLSRYETGIEGRFYKAYHELQRLQAARRAKGNVPPPMAIDVDISEASGEDFR